jgi:hypothetical protein
MIEVTDYLGKTSDPKIRNAVWKLTGGECARCDRQLLPSTGDSASMHVDHIVPKSKGGQDRLSNYQPLCRSCNLSKGDEFANYLTATMERPVQPNPPCTVDGCNSLSHGDDTIVGSIAFGRHRYSGSGWGEQCLAHMQERLVKKWGLESLEPAYRRQLEIRQAKGGQFAV